MALQRAPLRVDMPTVQTVGDAVARGNLQALSQRKLNALGAAAGLRRPQLPLPLRQPGVPRLARPASRGGDRPRDRRGARAARSGPLYHAYADAALEGERTGFERQLVTAGRPTIWIRVDYYPDRASTGRVRGFLVTYSDVDHLKRLELEAGQREHRLRLVTDSVGVPILYVDRQLKIRFANQPFADWIGVPHDDLLGHAAEGLAAGRRR